jgi:hypothetical protein
MYKLNKSLTTGEINSVILITEKFIISIPFDLDNTDYQQYLKWLDEGNTPLPADTES